jgi:hypothetical protein
LRMRDSSDGAEEDSDGGLLRSESGMRGPLYESNG